MNPPAYPICSCGQVTSIDQGTTCGDSRSYRVRCSRCGTSTVWVKGGISAALRAWIELTPDLPVEEVLGDEFDDALFPDS